MSSLPTASALAAFGSPGVASSHLDSALILADEAQRAQSVELVRAMLIARSARAAGDASQSTSSSELSSEAPGGAPLSAESAAASSSGSEESAHQVAFGASSAAAPASPPRTVLTTRALSVAERLDLQASTAASAAAAAAAAAAVDLSPSPSSSARSGFCAGADPASASGAALPASAAAAASALPPLRADGVPPGPPPSITPSSQPSTARAQPPPSPTMLPTRVGGLRVKWEEIDVASAEAFQRTVISGHDMLGEEQWEAFSMLHRALRLRERHFTRFRKHEYYWGHLDPNDFPSAPASRELHPCNEFGLRVPLRTPRSHTPSGGLSFGHEHRHSASFNAHPHARAHEGAHGNLHAHPHDAGAPAGRGALPVTPLRLSRADSEPAAAPVASPVHDHSAAHARAHAGAHSHVHAHAPLHAQASTGSPKHAVNGSAGPASSASASPTIQRLFFRRRPEPRFQPFQCPLLPRLDMQCSLVEGVFHCFERAQDAGVGAKRGGAHGAGAAEFDGLHASGSSATLRGADAAETSVAATSIRAQSSKSSSGSPSTLFRIGEETPRDLGAGEEEGVDQEAGEAGAGVLIPDLAASSALSSSPRRVFEVPSWREFSEDYAELLRIIHSPAVRTLSFRRLELLAARFRLHSQLNAERESQEQKAVPHRDFYNVRKVDTHVHHSACMNQKHLLRFIKSKLRKEPDTVVLSRDGRKLTLAEVFDSLNLTAYDLSIDMLDMHADNSTFHRFDRFNTKYNPQGSSRLREIFLKTDNLIGGRFLAEVTSEVLEDLALNKYQLAEYRLSIYGRARSEWRKLAAWVVQNRLVTKEVRWMIQVPRLYEVYKASGQVASFGDMLDNIFAPLFEVSLDPAADEQLHQFLSMVVGFDSVDDESRPEVASNTELPPPAQWRFSQQPPYHYWTYYLAANVAVLNQLRGSRGLSQFSFRPHAGEAGDVEHLAATFLTAEGINHGINLRRSPPLQYLYYLAQIGLAMSPLSNNRLFLELTKSPFPDFFAKGLNVSLSTDDPLMLAMTKEPLLEEYAVASQVYKLSSADLCEVARNSVLQSGFEYPFKAHFLGANFAEPGPDGNDIHFTNVPYIRTQFRLEALRGELELLRDAVAEAAAGRRALAGGGATAPVPAAASAASAAVAHPAVMHRSVSTVAAEASRMVIVNRHRQ